MKLRIIAPGRLKSAEAMLFSRYAERLNTLSVHEIAQRASPDKEQELIDRAIPLKAARLIALDEQGISMTSQAFSSWLSEAGMGEQVFIIGGAHGLSHALRQRADVLLSLGPMTWPHQIARILLAEQLYRAQSLLKGHPYHKP